MRKEYHKTKSVELKFNYISNLQKLATTTSMRKDLMTDELSAYRDYIFLGKMSPEERVIICLMDMFPEILEHYESEDEDFLDFISWKHVILSVDMRSGEEIEKMAVVDLDQNPYENGVPAVSSRTNYCRIRETLERWAGISSLYITEMKTTDWNPIQSTDIDDKEQKWNLEEIKNKLKVEAIINTKKSHMSLFDNYILKDRLFEVLNSREFEVQLQRIAVEEGFIENILDSDRILNYEAALLYYGAVNTEDTFVYKTMEPIWAKQLVLMIGKLFDSYRSQEEILRNADFCGEDPNSKLTLVKAAKLIIKNLEQNSDEMKIFMQEELFDEIGTKTFLDDMRYQGIHESDEDIQKAFVLYNLNLLEGVFETNPFSQEYCSDRPVTMGEAVRQIFKVLNYFISQRRKRIEGFPLVDNSVLLAMGILEINKGNDGKLYFQSHPERLQLFPDWFQNQAYEHTPIL